MTYEKIKRWWILSIALLLTVLVTVRIYTNQDKYSTVTGYSFTIVDFNLDKTSTPNLISSLDKFGSKQSIAIIKSFQVPTENEPVRKFYVFGDKSQYNVSKIEKNKRASAAQFEKSDIRTKYYLTSTAHIGELKKLLNHQHVKVEYQQKQTFRDKMLTFLLDDDINDVNATSIVLLIVFVLLFISMITCNYADLKRDSIEYLNGKSKEQIGLKKSIRDVSWLLVTAVLSCLLIYFFGHHSYGAYF